MSRLTLRAYPEYRESGVPWLGRVPAHWAVHRAKHFLYEVDERSITGEEERLSVSHITGVTPRSQKNVTMFEAESYVGHKLCRPGDVVANTMWTWMGAIGVSRHTGIVSPAYGVYRPRRCDDFDPRFLDYLLRTPSLIAEYVRRSTGIQESRLRLYAGRFLDIPFPHPGIEAQSAIANFLDGILQLTRRYERTKRRLTALLIEQRLRGVLHHISGGASTESKTPRTGVEWLGSIPSTWDVVALRMRYAVDLGKMLDAKQITGEHLRPYLRNVDVQWGRVNTVDLPQMDIEPHEVARYTLAPGDLLVCEGGEVGRAAFWEGELEGCAYQKALHRVRALDPGRDNPRFLYYLLFAAAKLGVFLADGSENTIAHLTREKLRAHRFPFPPREEQDAIVRRLDEEGAAIDRVVDRHLAEIRLMREYSTRIIAASVLGHLDVTNVHSAVAAPLIAEEPGGIEEAAGLDDPEEIMVMADDFVEAES